MTIDARIEYVTTDDGVSLACTKFGSGPALIYQFANPSSSYFEMELAFPPAVETYEALARFATVVRYDSRNTGLSTRGVEDVSIEAHVRDLEAVRVHFGLSSMALMFPFVWARVAVEYAAANSDRITALLLPYPMLHHERRPYAHLTDDILKAAMAAGPELYATISAAIWSGLDEQANTAWIARYSMESADFEDRMRCEAILSQHDARAAAANVQAPTLIIHRKLPQYNAGPSSAEMIREHRASITRLSAAIPGAETALFEGSSLWYSGDEEITARSVDFLQKVFARLSSPRAEPAQAHAPSGTAIILFTDIADSTALTERLGDARFRDASRALDVGLRAAIREAGGEAIEGKLLGDGVLATFASTAQAIDGARQCLALSAASELGLHIGLHAGDVIREEVDGRRDVFGGR